MTSSLPPMNETYLYVGRVADQQCVLQLVHVPPPPERHKRAHGCSEHRDHVVLHDERHPPKQRQHLAVCACQLTARQSQRQRARCARRRGVRDKILQALHCFVVPVQPDGVHGGCCAQRLCVDVGGHLNTTSALAHVMLQPIEKRWSRSQNARRHARCTAFAAPLRRGTYVQGNLHG